MFFLRLELAMQKKTKTEAIDPARNVPGTRNSRDEKDANEQEADSSKLEDARSSISWNTEARREETGTLIDTPQRRCDEAVVISEENSQHPGRESKQLDKRWFGATSTRKRRAVTCGEYCRPQCGNRSRRSIETLGPCSNGGKIKTGFTRRWCR